MGEINPEKIMQVGLGFWPCKVLLSAIEMEVFTELAKHPADLPSLQGRLGLHPRAARDFLDALVALGFLHRDDGIYRNAPETDLFLDKHKRSYLVGVGGAVIVYDAMIDDARSANAFGLMMSLNMMIETESGFDDTAADCIGWMREVGFKDMRVQHLAGPDSMVVGMK